MYCCSNFIIVSKDNTKMKQNVSYIYNSHGAINPQFAPKLYEWRCDVMCDMFYIFLFCSIETSYDIVFSDLVNIDWLLYVCLVRNYILDHILIYVLSLFSRLQALQLA